jgi:hypothetical protein
MRINNLFEISSEEKMRILSLHENATKNLYLLTEAFLEDYLKLDNRELGSVIFYKTQKKPYVQKYMNWRDSEIDKNISDNIENYIQSVYTAHRRGSNGEVELEKFGKFLKKNKNFLQLFLDFFDKYGIQTDVGMEFDPNLEDPESKKRREDQEKFNQMYPPEQKNKTP